MKTCGLRLQRCSFFKDVGNANDRWRVKGWNGIRETFDCTVAGISLHGVEILDLIFWWISCISTRFSSRTHSDDAKSSKEIVFNRKLQNGQNETKIHHFREKIAKNFSRVNRERLWPRLYNKLTQGCAVTVTVWQLTDCFWLWIELSFLASFSMKKTS